jgi:hypothetical protein
VLWAQRKELVYVTFEVFEVRDEKVELTPEGVTFTGVRGTDGAKFSVSLELYAPIDTESSKVAVGHRDVAVTLAKAEPGPFWPRLLKTAQKMHFVQTDFSKWKDEDEEEEKGEADFGGFGGFGGAGNFDMSQFAGNAAYSGEGFDEDEENDSESENAEGADFSLEQKSEHEEEENEDAEQFEN